MTAMRVLRPLLCISLLALGGCSVLTGGDQKPATIYAPTVRVTPNPSWPQVTWQLAINKPSAARVIDSPRINVRPTPGELQIYHGAGWAQPATDMLEDSVVRGFEDSGKIAAVARIGTGIRSDYKLAIDLRRFESDYAGQPVPSATIELNAKLLHSSDQRVVASRTFLVARPSSGTDVAAVAAAFEQALTQVTTDLVGWTLTTGQQDSAALPRTP
ncbi:cholesterol transport system auxiliary component [Xanthomonas arboricola]|uniref:Cholesterol transport system auxiliary component n=1 Tax=Xanthomonas cannabis TaxID=1885674 RepID=A0ABR6JFA9_9XANT|nr:ABC-type transport auxiliary lipoprotein family protein [Xanthomonas cannabis]MBB3800278.1 cholesterol transport system auxiliary component [Xanthomonas cannabis]MBB3805656.1 cholesterol transport system auxiliary component [Xanthomonas cannabis]MBB4591486.1 cholesterol transport system auxiliary component [Xanthomonas cannabis]MBB5521299.1 cholesterol transport system auxiliary component [Xanthomonas cannabis]